MKQKSSYFPLFSSPSFYIKFSKKNDKDQWGVCGMNQILSSFSLWRQVPPTISNQKVVSKCRKYLFIYMSIGQEGGGGINFKLGYHGCNMCCVSVFQIIMFLREGNRVNHEITSSTSTNHISFLSNVCLFDINEMLLQCQECNKIHLGVHTYENTCDNSNVVNKNRLQLQFLYM